MEQILTYVAGASGVVVAIMGAIKTAWKPKQKWLYWIPASVASAVAAYLVIVLAEVAFTWWIWLIASALIASFELLVQNGWWPKVRDFLVLIIPKLFKK